MTGKIDISPLIRFMETLPPSGDIELTLLKCHLLVEEALTEIIVKNHKHPKHIKDAKLSFSQKTKLARASNNINHEVWVWKALHLLNQARNELAHNLTYDEIEDKLNIFTLYVENNVCEWPEKAIGGKFSSFHCAVYLTFSVVSSVAKFDPSTVKARTLLTG